MRALLVLLLLACAPALPPPPSPAGDTMLYRWWGGGQREPTTMHHFLFGMMEECLGIKGQPVEGIGWISAEFIQRSDYIRLAGLWIHEPRMIVLTHQTWGSPAIVSHELIHDLMGLGNVDHARAEFEACSIKDWVP